MKLGIQGSRTLYCDDARKIITQAIQSIKPTAIVTSAKIDGVCRLARELAESFALPLTVYFVNPDHAAGMHDKRSRAVQRGCEYVLFIHDGQSLGTAHEIQIARQTSKPHKVHLVKPPKVEIDPETQAILNSLITA